MTPTEEALAELNSCNKPNISATAKKYHVDRKNLSKRFYGTSQSATLKHSSQQFLSIQQERTLIAYINQLTELGLPPTPSMLRNFAYDIAQKEPGKNWSHRFCQRWSDTLQSRYLKPIDNSRKKAESFEAFEYWFSLIASKIEQYGIEAQNIYNMDEKGFLIGSLTKAKRIFTKQWFENQRIIGNVQDGSREWITIIATICADRTALPPSLIYMAKTGDIQDSWVQDLEPDVHTAHVASSPTGWTNDGLGYEWLTKVFDRFSKSKARNGRDWRLLIIDGHGSHVNMKFLTWCAEHHILVAVYPPHSTHRLQPLDVCMFSPLAIAYSQELDAFLHRSQGLSSISKRDFFGLFWNAYDRSFTADNIASGWSKTGLYPLNPEAVMQLFKKPLASTEMIRASSQSSSSQSAISTSDWRSIRALVSEVVTRSYGIHDKKVQKLNNTILSLTTEVSLLKSQNNGYKQALFDEKKKRKRGRGLFEEVRAKDGQGATFFSPRKIKAAKDLLIQKEHAKEQEQRDKVAQKEARKKLQQQKQAEKEARKAERVQKALQRKEEVALQRRQTQLAKDARIAAKPSDSSCKKTLKKSKRPTKRVKHSSEPMVASHTPSSQMAVIQPATRAGRIIRRPDHLSDYCIDI
jgi:hypothetical protein